ncbi:MAG: PIN domain-containing protein [Planctomycetes bacterium]|jgi:predicted nucleic acid-binding protein|nr:PIN domain-containing protein [Planctomycetota bacterium]
MLTVDASVWVAAFDPKDRFHRRSTAFLREVSRREERLAGPAFVVLEVACAIARRAGDPHLGEVVADRLGAHPALLLHPLDEVLLAAAEALGVRRLLRGADALYAATAELLDARLVSWDEELLSRGGAIKPDTWLAGAGGPPAE